MDAQSSNLSRIEHKDNSLMTIDGGLERINSSMMSTNKESTNNNDFTVMFLRDQLNYLKEKIDKAANELEEKERLIQ